MRIRNPKFLVVSALCGAMGVLSGYAIYLTYRKVVSADAADHARARFLLTLLITAVISYAIEWIREVIREGKIERATHPIFRTMGTFVIVLMFELFVIGFHTTSDLSLDALRGVGSQLLGEKAASSGANGTLVLAAGLWIVVGALLAAWLSQSVRKPSGTTWQRIGRAGAVGIIGGLIFAPVVMALYILAGRCLVALLDVFHKYGGGYGDANYQIPLSTFWYNMFVSQNTPTKGWFPSAFFLFVTLPLGLLNMAANKNVGLFMACFLVLAVFVVSYPAVRKLKALRNPALQVVLGAIWVVCLVYTVLPFGDAMFRVASQLAHVQQLETLGMIVLSAAVMWAIPGGLLGSLTPLLRRAAAHTRNWAFVGYGSAALLIVATLLVRAWWPVIPALAALAVGYMFQRGSLVDEYWPFAALCVAAGICGATSIAQHLTFAHEVVDLHSIDVLRPAPEDQPAVASLFQSYDQLSPAEKAQVQASNNENVVVIHGPDGKLIFVAQRKIDVELAKQMQQMWIDHAAEIQQLNDSLVTHSPEPPVPAAKDLPPPSPLIEAAVKRLNDPNAAPEPPPAPSPPHDDLAVSKELSRIEAESSVSFPSDSSAHRSSKRVRPAVVGTSPTEVAASPVATATPSTPEAAQPAVVNSTNQQTDTSAQLDEQRKEERAAKALELSLSGSVGFWVTIGLLACWSMQENEEREEHADAA